MFFKSRYLLPVGVFSFAAVVVGYVNIIFNTSTRWAVLLLMLVVLLLRGDLFVSFVPASDWYWLS